MHDRLSESAEELELFEGARLFEIACASRGIERKYRSRINPTFTNADISRIEFGSTCGRAELEVAGFGLYGIEGSLPAFYTRLIGESAEGATEDGENPLRDFLDMFSHRLISLLFWCTAQTRLDLLSVGGLGNDLESDPTSETTSFLFGIAGISEWDIEEAGVSKALVAHYCALFAIPERPSLALESLLEDFTGLPVSIADSVGPNGETTVAIGPMPWVRFREFYPAFPCLSQLLKLCRLFTGPLPRFSVKLILSAMEIPELTLGDDDDNGGSILEWDSWLEPTFVEDGVLFLDTDLCLNVEKDD